MNAEPAWVRHAIWRRLYPLGFAGTYPPLPAAPAGPHEHRLRRVIAWLDHEIELGASGIALGPIFSAATHGYDTLVHLRIDPRLGDSRDFDALVSEAHRRGLRVQLDGVFNHVSRRHPLAEAALRDGPGSRAARWFRGDDAIRPEFPAPGPSGLTSADQAICRLHQRLIGLRRRHPWLHQATSTTLQLRSDQYVIRVAHRTDSLHIALNLADHPTPASAVHTDPRGRPGDRAQPLTDRAARLGRPRPCATGVTTRTPRPSPHRPRPAVPGAVAAPDEHGLSRTGPRGG